ncbi:MAG: hypothetical protein PUA73_03785 [Bacilli bacterium]|nr:hypothetical protein [Bacilli bacterium]
MSTLSAVAIGYLLLDDTTANEQNALGNWLMLIAQMLCTNAYFVQLKEEKGSKNDKENTIYLLEKIIKAIEKEINNLKK